MLSKLATGCGIVCQSPDAVRARICAPCRSTSSVDGRNIAPPQMHSRFTTGSSENCELLGIGMPRSIA